MSTYLLLRNNKQTGPYTLEEIKSMSLKSYDLVWIEGKSAAWRYPGEITEFSSFAPVVPEQPYDRFFKKAGTETAKKESHVNSTRIILPNQESVYINLPASEKRLSGIGSAPQRRAPLELNWEEPIRQPEAYKITERHKASSGRSLLIISIALMFIAGLITGFIISNRRIFYSANGNSTQAQPPARKSSTALQANPVKSGLMVGDDKNRQLNKEEPGSLKEPIIPSGITKKKKSGLASFTKKNSQPAAPGRTPVEKVSDSTANLRENDNENSSLAEKIRANPSDYLIVTAGKYKVGILGGISEVPLMITNRSGVTMDLVVVAVDYVLHNNKVFKTENLSFRNLASGTTVTAEAPKSPRGVKITYRLTIADAQQIDMSYSN